MMAGKGTLFLIPTTLGDSPISNVIPEHVQEIVNSVDHYVAEDIRHARRYLSKLGIKKPINTLEFESLNKRTQTEEISELLEPALNGHNLGLMSEAGCPGIADPGADLVREAHQKGVQVVPLVGPSSLLLALIGSGLNGQQFTFNGYLPKDSKLRCQALLHLEKLALAGTTQLFIETPFRNQQMFEDIVKSCAGNTRLCIATDLTLQTESLLTKPVSQWRKHPPAFKKRPTVFLLGS